MYDEMGDDDEKALQEALALSVMPDGAGAEKDKPQAPPEQVNPP